MIPCDSVNASLLFTFPSLIPSNLPAFIEMNSFHFVSQMIFPPPSQLCSLLIFPLQRPTVLLSETLGWVPSLRPCSSAPWKH